MNVPPAFRKNVWHFQSIERKKFWIWKKEEHKRYLFAHSLAKFLPVKQFWLVKAKVACLATIIPLAKSPLMGQLAVVEPTVLSVTTEGSQTWQEMECRFTPVENYTSAGLKGLTKKHSCTIHRPHRSTCTHASSTNIHMRTRLQSKACGDFHWTQGAVEFHHTCQGFHAKLPFNGILNGRNLAQCFSSCSVPDFAPSDII